MVSQPVAFLKNKAYFAVALTHFCVDVLNNGRTLLVAIMAVELGLTNAQVGLALLIYNLGSSLSQPLFGLLADRIGPRLLVVGGMAWMILLYSAAALVGDGPALAAVTLAGLGSGAFHPPGTKIASEASHDRPTRATALFFTAGQLGLFAGPVLAGVALQAFGRPGYIVLPALALSALIGAWRWVVNEAPVGESAAEDARLRRRAGARIGRPTPWRTVIPLTIIIMTSSTIGITAINFAPKLFTELGYAPAYVGWTAGLFMLGSAFGGIVGGALGDRTGRRTPILIGTLGAIVPLYYYIPAGDPWRFGLLMLAGFFAGMPHSVLVIAAQSLLPGRRATASGLALGVMFFSGAVGTYLVGVAADRFGLAAALQATILLPLVAAAAAVFLPDRALHAAPAATIPRTPADSVGS